MQASGTAETSLSTRALQELDDPSNENRRAVISDVAAIVFIGTTLISIVLKS